MPIKIQNSVLINIYTHTINTNQYLLTVNLYPIIYSINFKPLHIAAHIYNHIIYFSYNFLKFKFYFIYISITLMQILFHLLIIIPALCIKFYAKIRASNFEFDFSTHDQVHFSINTNNRNKFNTLPVLRRSR